MAKNEFTQVLFVDELNKHFRKLRDLRNTIYKLQVRKHKPDKDYNADQLWWLDEDEEFIKEYERVCGEYWNWLRAIRNWLTSNYVDANIADGILNGFSKDLLE